MTVACVVQGVHSKGLDYRGGRCRAARVLRVMASVLVCVWLRNVQPLLFLTWLLELFIGGGRGFLLIVCCAVWFGCYCIFVSNTLFYIKRYNFHANTVPVCLARENIEWMMSVECVDRQ